MAGTNKLIQYGTWNLGTDNTYTDDELIALTTEQKKGIVVGTIAYSNILNAVIRQTSLTTKVLGDVIALKADADINSGITPAVYATRMVTAISNIAKEVTVTIAAITYTGTRSGVTVNAQGLVTNVVALVANDIPSLAIAKITGLADALDGTVASTVTIAGLDLSTNRSRDDIIGISSGTGFVKRSALNTYVIDATTYTPVARTIAGLDLTVDRSLDNIMGITTGIGHVKRIAANDYSIDTGDYPVRDDVILKDPLLAGSSLTLWKGTQIEYNALTADNDTIYIIVD